MSGRSIREFILKEEEELRIEVEYPTKNVESTKRGVGDKTLVDFSVDVELVEGMGEVFGTEMIANSVYNFKSGSKFAIFTYHGCKVKLTHNLPEGVTSSDGVKAIDMNFEDEMDDNSEVNEKICLFRPYVSQETPMIIYLNVHASLQSMRMECSTSESSENAENRVEEQKQGGNNVQSKRGPVVMIVGPTDVGKSTLCRILLNYAVRMSEKPLFVDLDVGQGEICVPGSIGAILIESPASIDEGFSQSCPLVYHYGHKTPGHNPTLFNRLVSRMAQVVNQRMSSQSESCGKSGVIINTCGWVRGQGYKQLHHIAQAFEVDVVLVLDQERLYNDLVRDMPSFVKIVWLPKSGGVVERLVAQRSQARDQRIMDYFYGKKKNLFPHSFDIPFSELTNKIYKIGSPTLPDSLLPIGMKRDDSAHTKLVPVLPSAKRDLLNRLLAVSHVSSEGEGAAGGGGLTISSDMSASVIVTNVAGYVCVTNIDVEQQVVKVLSPQPPPLPKTILLLSEIHHVDLE